MSWEMRRIILKDIDPMPLKCLDCPDWEKCEEPYVCPEDAIPIGDMFEKPDMSMLESLLRTK